MGQLRETGVIDFGKTCYREVANLLRTCYGEVANFLQTCYGLVAYVVHLLVTQQESRQLAMDLLGGLL